MVDREQQRGEEQADLKVTDRRLFTADGELRAAPVEEDEPAPPAPAFEHRPVEEPSGVDFTMLINAMAEPALLFLGEIKHPGSGESMVDFDRARIQIDMLDLLRVKCRGNMTPEEEGLLDRILYQLRMVFVARSGAKPQPGIQEPT
jgi:hypothetical protein